MSNSFSHLTVRELPSGKQKKNTSREREKWMSCCLTGVCLLLSTVHGHHTVKLTAPNDAHVGRWQPSSIVLVGTGYWKACRWQPGFQGLSSWQQVQWVMLSETLKQLGDLESSFSTMTIQEQKCWRQGSVNGTLVCKWWGVFADLTVSWWSHMRLSSKQHWIHHLKFVVFKYDLDSSVMARYL